MSALIGAAEEVTATVLGWETNGLEARPCPFPADDSGGYIALIGKGSLYIGVSADSEGCQAMTRALLAMEPEEADPSNEDVADALGEIANVLAGMVKTTMAAHDPSLKLGLPIVVHGQVERGTDSEMAVSKVSLGPVEARLIVLRDSLNGGIDG
jgi:CheY-specific phosphatase CheX